MYILHTIIGVMSYNCWFIIYILYSAAAHDEQIIRFVLFILDLNFTCKLNGFPTKSSLQYKSYKKKFVFKKRRVHQ